MSSICLLLHTSLLSAAPPLTTILNKKPKKSQAAKENLAPPKAGKSVKAAEKARTASKGCCPASSLVKSDLFAETLKKVKTMINSKVLNKGLSKICL